MKDEKDPQQKTTLTDDDIEVSKKRGFGRRTAVRIGSAATVGSAMALATGCRPRRRVVRVQTVSGGLTDNDGGPCADPVNGGRGNSGITDSDGGACADPGGRGRGGGGGGGGTGITDSDGGPNADAAGYGRGGGGASGITDSDGGPCSDPGGNGRGYSGMTDSDGGTCSDPGGRGRRGY